jgi:class 3 adenylate cyclase/pimeloyl-ACP methyl ester carboxylesterase
VEVPEVHYVRSGDVAIAYQVVGEGRQDVVLVPFFSNLVYPWREPHWTAYYRRLASLGRLILLDKRGQGLSDSPRELGTLETRMDDIRAVLDAVGYERATLIGAGEGGQTCALFAATYPERTERLVLVGTPARVVSTPDYPYGFSPEEWHRNLREIRDRWGEREYLEQQARMNFPVADAAYVEWFVECQRICASPGATLAFYRMYGGTDIRDVLSAVRVPTLVIFRPNMREQMLDVARRIPNAEAVATSPPEAGIFFGEEIVPMVERFLAGESAEVVPDRVLATVLFTDIVGSTERAAALGDRAWRDLVAAHHAMVRRELARFRGEEVDTAGDGFFATFDGPARAIGCARAVTGNARELSLEVRAGVHTGECELLADKVGGIAVHIGARIATLAEPGEVLVSRTVTDLVAGSELEFDDRGVRELKGVPGEWRLYAVRA